jgi:hypothetical protein
VRNSLGLLDQAVGEDRERVDVAVLHELLRVLGLGRLVEEPVGVNAFLALLENGMPQNVLRGAVPMLPDERDTLGVLVLEGVGLDNAPVGALQTVLSGPATEVRGHGVVRVHQAGLRRRVTEIQSGMLSHFDCSFRLLDLRRS